MAVDASQPNLRQVHVIHIEIFATSGLDLLRLPVGTRLVIGDAVISVTGLVHPCRQIDDFRPGLRKQVLRRASNRRVERLAGIVGAVARTGRVAPGDTIAVQLPAEPRYPLTPV